MGLSLPVATLKFLITLLKTASYLWDILDIFLLATNIKQQLKTIPNTIPKSIPKLFPKLFQNIHGTVVAPLASLRRLRCQPSPRPWQPGRNLVQWCSFFHKKMIIYDYLSLSLYIIYIYYYLYIYTYIYMISLGLFPPKLSGTPFRRLGPGFLRPKNHTGIRPVASRRIRKKWRVVGIGWYREAASQVPIG
jgi:hypothetical protein